MDYNKRRKIAFAAAIAIEICSGIVYAWSVFTGPLMAKYGCTPQQLSLMYTGNFWFSAVGFLFLGPLAKRKMPVRNEVLLGSILYVGSILGSALAGSSFLALVLLFGVMRSVGLSFVYPVLMSYAVELYPERSGWASGMMTAGFGLGAMIWAPLTSRVYEASGDISVVFAVLGGIFAVVMIPLCFLLIDPAASTAGTGKNPADGAHAKAPMALYDVPRRQLFSIPLFYVAFLALVFALSCGNLIVNQSSPIMQGIFGMDATGAALVVSAAAVCNVLGRLVCGPASDKFGKSQVACVLSALTVGAMAVLALWQKQAPFTAFMLLAVFCYGGLNSLVPPLTREMFGSKNFTGNYTVFYLVYAIGSLTGPVVGVSLLAQTGSYTAEFAYGTALAVLGGVGLLFVLVRVRKTKTKIQEGK